MHIDESLVLAVAALTKARRGFLITDKPEQRAKRRALIASIKLDIGDGKGKRRLLLVRKRREEGKKTRKKAMNAANSVWQHAVESRFCCAVPHQVEMNPIYFTCTACSRNEIGGV